VSAFDLATGLLFRELPGLADGSALELEPPMLTLAATLVAALVELPNLCDSVDRKVEFARPVVALLINTIKAGESSLSGLAVKSLSAVLSAASEGAKAVELLQSGLKSVIDALDDAKCKNPAQLIMALAIFTVTGGERVAHSELQTGSYRVLKRSLEPATETKVQAKAVQVTVSLMKLPAAVAGNFVREVAPHAIALLSAAASSKPTSAEEVAVLGDVMQLLVAVVSHADELGQPKVMAMVVALLVALLEADPQACGPVHRRLHDLALATLTKTGPLFPAAFRTVIAGAPALAQQMAAAVRAKAQFTAAAAPANGQSAAAQKAAAIVGKKPTIALKMDFSSFG
jgi:hypothetical protein